MKRIFALVFSITAFVAFADAQIFTAVKDGANNIYYAGTAADTSGTANVSVYKVINAKALNYPYHFAFTVNVDDLSGNVAGHTIKIEGSSDGTTYDVLNTYTMSDADALWNVTTRDTVAYCYPYLRVHLDSDGTGVTKILSIYGKIVGKK